jgi:HD-GYP domain-containing protein (c-di-GMP phosphodiesterase class II)
VSSVVSKRTFVVKASAGFQMGGQAAPDAQQRLTRRPHAPAARPRTFGSRSEAFDDAAEVLRQLKAPVGELMRQARLGRAIDTELVVPVVAEVAGSIQTHPSALLTLARIKVKNERAYMHAVAVCALMINLGRQLGLDQGSLRDLGMAGLLHDIGETALPSGLLDREIRFSAEELALVRRHPEFGHEQLARMVDLPAVVLDVCLHHHERVDGKGYPSRTGEARLSLEAKMAAICDVYDAITSYRPYDDFSTPSAGLSEMFSATGQFDPALLSHFIRSVGIYPAGSLVRLESDNLALVIDQAGENLTKPIVRIFYSILDRARIAPRDIDLSVDNSDAITGREEPRQWGFTDWDNQWPHLIRIP